MANFLRFLTDEDRARLLADAQRREYAPEEVILRQGERRHAIFVLNEGEARVEHSHGEFYVEISRLRGGEVFGEMGFVEDFEASANVVAESRCSVDVIDAAHVQGLIDTDPGFYGRFYQSLAHTLSQRLRETTVDGIAEFAWGGRPPSVPGPESADESATGAGWGGGSPLRDDDGSR